MAITVVDFTWRITATLRSHVEVLAREPRWPGTQHHDFCRSYIRDQLEREGILISEQRFDASGQTGINLVTAPLGSTAAGPLLVIGAHYDSREDTPGADDNA